MTVLLHLTEAARGFFLPTLCNNCTLTSSYYYRFTNKSNLMLWLISTGNDQLKHYAYHLRLGNAICSTCLLYGCQQRVTYITPTFLPFHWKRRLLTWHKWPWLTKGLGVVWRRAHYFSTAPIIHILLIPDPSYNRAPGKLPPLGLLLEHDAE